MYRRYEYKESGCGNIAKMTINLNELEVDLALSE